MKKYNVRTLEGISSIIECDGIDIDRSGCYVFWKYECSDSADSIRRIERVAYCPINGIIIVKIEDILESKNK